MNILFLDWPCFGRTDLLDFFYKSGDCVTLFSHPEYNLRNSSSFMESIYPILEKQHFDFCFSYNFFHYWLQHAIDITPNMYLLSMIVHR